MAQSIAFPYGDVGVKIPYRYAGPRDEWSEDDRIQKDGFLLVDILSPNVFLVQSIGNNRLYANKILREGEDKDYQGPAPPEFRISTWGKAPNQPFDEDGRHIDGNGGNLLGDAGNGNNGGANEGSDGSNTNNFFCSLALEPYFHRLAYWQRLRGGNGEVVYSFYHQYCNGGQLSALIEKYARYSMRVPEHFIWRVAEQIGEALAWLNFGRPRGSTDAMNGPKDWRTVYHLDMYPNNIWLNYPPPATGRKTKGERANAFPDITLGDFGKAYIEGNPKPPNLLEGNGRWPATPHKDIDGLSDTLRQLALANYAGDESGDESEDEGANGKRYDNCKVREVINLEKNGKGPVYSDALIDMLEMLEWKRNKYDVPLSWQRREDGGYGKDDLPDIDWVVNTMLPKARDQVARRSRELPEGTDYRDMDVSWTKPILGCVPWLCSHETPHGLNRLYQLESCLGSFRDVCPQYEFQRLLFGPPKLIPMGYGDASSELAEPIFADRDNFDIRGCEPGAVYSANMVHRGYRRKARGLLDALESLVRHETDRLDDNEPPSESDQGEDGGPHERPKGRGLYEKLGAHPRLQEMQRRLAELLSEVDEYQGIRNKIRETGKGEPRKRPSPTGEQEGSGSGEGEDNGRPSKRQKSK